MENNQLLVLTCGQEDGGSRATLAFALAVSLQAMGANVSIYLNSQASVWAFDNIVQHINIPGFDSLSTYIEIFQECGGKLYICASCIEDLLNPKAESNLPHQQAYGVLRQGVTPAGMTTLASLILESKVVSL